jgi:mannose-6-phosphate isomerase-like protein (cupin superfamily)
MSRTGETLVDIAEATVRVLADRPELVLTYMRSRTEGGPGRHLHRQHADGFVVLEGEASFLLGEASEPRGAETIVAVPPELVHTYQHEGTDQVAFLNFHAPGVGFAEYLFGQSPADRADTFFDPEESGRDASDATVLRLDEGETITDTAARNVRILVDLPEIVVTWTRYSHGEAGPDPHIHREHVDAFYILDGELLFRVGPELDPVNATPGTFVLAPPEVVHTFRNESGADARFLNFHAPSAGFAEFLRNTELPWDSFDAPADGGRPASEAIVQHVHPA